MKAHGSKPVRVLVVWEPVLPTDWGSPSPSLTSFVGDARAIHFWDRGRRLSGMLSGPPALDSLAHTKKVDFQMRDLIWDAAFVYPPGARWGDRAETLLAPVVDYAEDLAAAVAR